MVMVKMCGTGNDGNVYFKTHLWFFSVNIGVRNNVFEICIVPEELILHVVDGESVYSCDSRTL